MKKLSLLLLFGGLLFQVSFSQNYVSFRQILRIGIVYISGMETQILINGCILIISTS